MGGLFSKPKTETVETKTEEQLAAESEVEAMAKRKKALSQYTTTVLSSPVETSTQKKTLLGG